MTEHLFLRHDGSRLEALPLTKRFLKKGQANPLFLKVVTIPCVWFIFGKGKIQISHSTFHWGLLYNMFANHISQLNKRSET